MSIQLICINYGNYEHAIKVMEHCASIVKFDKATLLHPNPRSVAGFYDYCIFNTSLGVSKIEVVKSISPTQNECFSFELPQYITCDHAIGIQWDGFIIRPDLWDSSWLQYDWIAPPWPLHNIPNPEHRVGSGGFIMFSKRMSQLWPKILDTDSYNDWQIGATKRDQFEAQGMRYAPIEVAEKFGREIPIEDSTVEEGDSFGFHDFRHEVEKREKWRKQVYE